MPTHLFPDSKNTGEFYIQGAFDGMGGIMKPLRLSGKVEWFATFNYISTANAYTLIDSSYHVVGCGYTGSVFTDPSAGFFRISNDGTLQWFISI
ncbi:MAG: hypothetical protein ACMG6E_01395 [Candidatus Roizmanbacteria bacterium]